MSGLALAIDIGGTKIAAAAVTRGGEVLQAVETPTRAGEGTDAVTAALTSAARTILDGEHGPNLSVVGVSSAGPLDVRTGTVSPLNIADWREFPLMERVSELTPGLPAAFALDGVALAAAELAFGGARGHSDALCITVSTGIGGGLIIDGRVLHGTTGNAGHIGHLVVDVEGPPCACGGRGCVEALASGPSMLRWAVGEGWSDDPSTVATLAEAARAGDPVAIAAFDRAARALGAAVAGTAALVGVEVAVVSGGVAQSGEVLFEPLQRHLDGYARLSFTRGVQVHRSPLGRNACLLGAAHLALEADDGG